eukprot:1159111-Pelagomonas_calceolata.AAC.2
MQGHHQLTLIAQNKPILSLDTQEQCTHHDPGDRYGHHLGAIRAGMRPTKRVRNASACHIVLAFEHKRFWGGGRWTRLKALTRLPVSQAGGPGSIWDMASQPRVKVGTKPKQEGDKNDIEQISTALAQGQHTAFDNIWGGKRTCLTTSIGRATCKPQFTRGWLLVRSFAHGHACGMMHRRCDSWYLQKAECAGSSSTCEELACLSFADRYSREWISHNHSVMFAIATEPCTGGC